MKPLSLSLSLIDKYTEIWNIENEDVYYSEEDIRRRSNWVKEKVVAELTM
jgi:hypothetical protein